MRIKSKVIYMCLLIIICLGIIIGFKSFGKKEYVKGSELDQNNSSVWASTIAKNINESLIILNIDGKKLKNEQGSFYMNDSFTLMIPIDIITDYFDCAANVYDKNKLIIEKGSNKLEITKGLLYILKNGESISIENTMVEKNGTFYVPSEILVKGLDYEYLWDAKNCTAMLTSNNSSPSGLPYYYNYEENGRVPEVKDQGRWGTCWSFASLTAFESSLLPEESFDFSEDHMSINNSYNLSQNDGGDYTMSISYLASWKGPVLEIQDPYGDGKTVDGLSAIKHLQEVQIIKSKDYDAIKEMVFKYGGVQSSLYTSMVNSYNSSSYYYNKKTNSYCYIGTQKPNHDVVIIGWDDNYSKENFNADLEGDGAFICRNSWGSDFGDNGTFYVSYYDSIIGIHNVAYTKIEDTDNYDNIYQSDLCGWVGQLGYGRDSAYFANVYTSKGQEELTAVSFYATDINTEYSIYVCSNFVDTTSLNILKQPDATGEFTNAGYYTVDLDQAVSMKPNEKYAIIIKITTPNSTRPIAIEYANDKKTSKVDLSDGEGYISLRGFDWESTEQKHGCNVCLKAFTNEIK